MRLASGFVGIDPPYMTRQASGGHNTCMNGGYWHCSAQASSSAHSDSAQVTFSSGWELPAQPWQGPLHTTTADTVRQGLRYACPVAAS